MAQIIADDGVRLYCEETGAGAPIVFVHEYAGDFRSFESQVRYFSRRYRCIAYNARGYPPSDVPESLQSYSQKRARDDLRCVLDGLKISKAHLVGVSMGAFALLHFGFAYPERALSLVVAACGYGAEPGDSREEFIAEATRLAEEIAEKGMAEVSKTYGAGPARVQYRDKDPRGYAEFLRQLGEHSTLGSANTMRGVQARRPSLWSLVEEMDALDTPTLVMTGDEDSPCLAPSLLMKRHIKSAALVVLPNAGHSLNREEPDLFNRFCDEFFHQVEAGRWRRRNPSAIGRR